MAKAIIGGDTVNVSLANYVTLKRAWAYINSAQGTTDFIVSMDAIVGTIAVAVTSPFPGESVPIPGAAVGGPGDVDFQDLIEWRIAYIGEKLKPSEISGLRPFMNDLMLESGLADPEPKAAKAKPSTATSTR